MFQTFSQDSSSFGTWMHHCKTQPQLLNSLYGTRLAHAQPQQTKSTKAVPLDMCISMCFHCTMCFHMSMSHHCIRPKPAQLIAFLRPQVRHIYATKPILPKDFTWPGLLIGRVVNASQKLPVINNLEEHSVTSDVSCIQCRLGKFQNKLPNHTLTLRVNTLMKHLSTKHMTKMNPAACNKAAHLHLIGPISPHWFILFHIQEKEVHHLCHLVQFQIKSLKLTKEVPHIVPHYFFIGNGKFKQLAKTQD